MLNWTVFFAMLLALNACRTSIWQDGKLDSTSTSTMVSASKWKQHYLEDLLPFWIHAEALGSPVGNFPTFRCNDGRRFNSAEPCPELKDSDDWIRSELGRNYTRMISRQIFFYGVGFHLIGDVRLLELAKNGVDFIRKNAINADGSVVTYFENGRPDTLGVMATSQNAACVLSGLAFYYYLTRDNDVLKDILRIKNYIFSSYFTQNYFASGAGFMRLNQSPIPPEQQDLTAHLDQLYAYMVLLTPLLPDEEKIKWDTEMRQLVGALRHTFYSPADGLFFGQLHDKSTALPGWGHMDFGHTAKTFWMMGIIAAQTGDDELRQFAGKGGMATLKTANLGRGQDGRPLGYASRPNLWQGVPPQSTPAPLNCPAGIKKFVNCEQEWWAFAELNELGETLAVDDSEAELIVDDAGRYWLDQMVDPLGKEVWHMRSAPYGTPKLPKAHLWKNGLHTAEHALIGYLTAHWRARDAAPLYFAFMNVPKVEQITPYFFRAKINSMKSIKGGRATVQLITFSGPGVR